jgi:hypothetical protein
VDELVKQTAKITIEEAAVEEEAEMEKEPEETKPKGMLFLIFSIDY